MCSLKYHATRLGEYRKTTGTAILTVAWWHHTNRLSSVTGCSLGPERRR